MTADLSALKNLVALGDWRVSNHAFDRISKRGLVTTDIADGIASGVPIEDYPDYYAGPCILVLQSDHVGPLHALWGLEKGTSRPAVLITAYRPDPKQWLPDNRTRR